MVIGIDSDVTKSGVAVLNCKNLKLYNFSFFELFDFLKANKNQIKIVKVEAGYLNSKSNFHGAKNIQTAARIGKNVGACNEVAKKIVEMCEYCDIPVKEVKPFKKVWKSGKISHVELFAQLIFRDVGCDVSRTNQEQRDAALICLLG